MIEIAAGNRRLQARGGMPLLPPTCTRVLLVVQFLYDRNNLHTYHML